MDEETTGLYRLRNLIRNNIPLHFLVISENKFYHFQVGLFVCFFLSFFLSFFRSFFFLSFFLLLLLLLLPLFFGIEIIFLLNEKHSCFHGLLFDN